MSGWQQTLARFAENIEEEFDRLRFRIDKRLAGDTAIKIVPYRGYGSAERLWLKGRVLRDSGVSSSQEKDTVWENLVNMYRRFESDEIPHARVRLEAAGLSTEVVADEEGFFTIDVRTDYFKDRGAGWHQLPIRLVEPDEDEEVVAMGHVLVRSDDSSIGVISDLDDTVVKTDATSLLKMARNVFLSNAHSRLPFAGVSAFYRALHAGLDDKGMNPLFYVSSSPWNLYDLLEDFLDLQKIPLGPIFLRDWGLTETELLPLEHRTYKLNSIRKILDFYPSLSFVLIGDSGQEDPEIYAQIVEEYPQRIEAIYIRNVSLDHVERPDAVRNLAEEVKKSGSELLLVDDTIAAAAHALSRGWIASRHLDDVAAEAEIDTVSEPDELDMVDESERPQRGEGEAADLVEPDQRR